jgi:hypothetical protein
MRGRITHNALKYRRDRRQYCGGSAFENGEMTAVCKVMPAISAIQSVFERKSALHLMRGG